MNKDESFCCGSCRWLGCDTVALACWCDKGHLELNDPDCPDFETDDLEYEMVPA